MLGMDAKTKTEDKSSCKPNQKVHSFSKRHDDRPADQHNGYQKQRLDRQSKDSHTESQHEERRTQSYHKRKLTPSVLPSPSKPAKKESRRSADRNSVRSSSHNERPRSRGPSITISGNTDWGTKMEEDELRKEAVLLDLQRYKQYLKRFDGKGRKEGQERKEPKIETDETVLVRRQKQIDYGKNTPTYENYLKKVPIKSRVKGKHPVTPNKFQVASRRSWEAQIKSWKVSLHTYSGDTSKIARSKSVSEKSETASEAESHMDVETSSLDTSLASSLSEYIPTSNEGSRPHTPVEDMETHSDDDVLYEDQNTAPSKESKASNYGYTKSRYPLTNLPQLTKPKDGEIDVNSNQSSSTGITTNVTGMILNDISNQRSLYEIQNGCLRNPLLSQFSVPKTPTGTPVEQENVPIPQNSPPQFNATELLEALERAGISLPKVGPAMTRSSSRQLACSFENGNYVSACNNKDSSRRKDMFDEFDLDQCFKEDGFEMQPL